MSEQEWSPQDSIWLAESDLALLRDSDPSGRGAALYLLATPPRLAAEELLEALRALTWAGLALHSRVLSQRRLEENDPLRGTLDAYKEADRAARAAIAKATGG